MIKPVTFWFDRPRNGLVAEHRAARVRIYAYVQRTANIGARDRNHRTGRPTLIATGWDGPAHDGCNSTQGHCNGTAIGPPRPTLIATRREGCLIPASRQKASVP